MIPRMAAPEPTRPAAQFAGEFETHITVDCGEDALAGLQEWSSNKGMKLTHIMLGRGRMCSQIMLTFTGAGTLPEQHSAAVVAVHDVNAAGFRCTRVKIEAAPGNADVPQDSDGAGDLGSEFYFEHHIKLALDPGVELEPLLALVIPHTAHVSWNARRRTANGVAERFVTQRCHGVGRPEATSRLADLSAVLRDHSYQIVSTVQEFVVFDSDATLDAGWIDPDKYAEAVPTA
jgi:hypothetical protein